MSIHEQFIYHWLREFKLYQRVKKPLTKEQAAKFKYDYQESNEVIYRLRKKWGIKNLEKVRKEQARKVKGRKKCKEYYERNKLKIKVKRCSNSATIAPN